MGAEKTVSVRYLEKELEEILESNTTIKAAANMVGYDVDEETDRLLKNVDQRIRVNLYQRGRIATLRSLIEEAR